MNLKVAARLIWHGRFERVTDGDHRLNALIEDVPDVRGMERMSADGQTLVDDPLEVRGHRRLTVHF